MSKNPSEFELIHRMTQNFSKQSQKVLIGVGDDCAVLDAGNNSVSLVTTDLLIERVHFLFDPLKLKTLGRKTLAVNLSDIAAMGGTPESALLSIAIPKHVKPNHLDSFMSGIQQIAEEFSTSLVGGDTTSSMQDLVINIALIGSAPKDRFVTRSGARPGDLIQVSGPLGLSAAGLNILLSDIEYEENNPLIKAHFDPVPRIETGIALAGIPGVHAMIDISDGVIQDLGHICKASQVKARIDGDKIPVNSELQKTAKILKKNPWTWILCGGEDYELCWCVDPADEKRALGAAKKAGAPYPVTIGTIIETIGNDSENLVKVLLDNQELLLNKSGWDHFRR